MGRIPPELRSNIARNIRRERQKKYGYLRGTGKICAEEFGVSPQQWSPWECGQRTPDELRLEQMADFFGVSVAYLRRPEHLFDLTFAQFTENPGALPPPGSGDETARNCAHGAESFAFVFPHAAGAAPQQRELFSIFTAFMRAMTHFLNGGFDVALSLTPKKPPEQPKKQT